MSRADNERLESAYDVQHITSFAGGVDLTAVYNRQPCRRIVMAEAGDLTITTKTGNVRTLTGLPQWHAVDVQATAIPATQTAAVIVYW
jgi:hypothetical protein